MVREKIRKENVTPGSQSDPFRKTRFFSIYRSKASLHIIAYDFSVQVEQDP